MRKYFKKYQFILFSLAGAVFVLWKMLFPGYVLMLDWPAGPQINFSYYSLSDILNAPTAGIFYLLGLIFPAWMIQKAILFAMIFVIFYLPLKFFPFARKNGNEYFASLLFVFNPFLYERFLAGQWRVILGYALLWPFFYFLISYFTKPSRKAMFGAFGWLVIVGMFSVHGLAIGIVVGLVAFAFCFLQRLREKNFKTIRLFAFDFLWALIGFLVVSLYWIVPFFSKGVNTLDDFDKSHQVAFATATDSHVGVVGNVLTLRGFWGEDHAWVDQFILPAVIPFLFYLCFILIATLCFFGVRELLQREKTRLVAKFLSIVFVLSVIFSAGISAHGIWGINQWLFDHVGLWNGFRDTQKWSGVTALIFSLLGSVGVGVVAEQFAMKKKLRTSVLLFCFALPIFWAPMMLGGLCGQLKAVWYPQSWHQANEILQKDEQCKAVFLPWHQYYNVDFNDGILVANPANSFFDCEMISGHNTELGEMQSIAGDVEGYAQIEEAVMSNNLNQEEIQKTIEILKKNKIKYVVRTNDMEEKDQYRYPFFSSAGMSVVYEGEGIVLYRVDAKL